MSKLNEKTNVIQTSGLQDAYEHLLVQLCHKGLPTGNVYEFAAQTLLKYEKKIKTENIQLKAIQANKDAHDKYIKKMEEKEAQSNQQVSKIEQIFRDEQKLREIAKTNSNSDKKAKHDSMMDKPHTSPEPTKKEPNKSPKKSEVQPIKVEEQKKEKEEVVLEQQQQQQQSQQSQKQPEQTKSKSQKSSQVNKQNPQNRQSKVPSQNDSNILKDLKLDDLKETSPKIEQNQKQAEPVQPAQQKKAVQEQKKESKKDTKNSNKKK